MKVERMCVRKRKEDYKKTDEEKRDEGEKKLKIGLTCLQFFCCGAGARR